MVWGERKKMWNLMPSASTRKRGLKLTCFGGQVYIKELIKTHTLAKEGILGSDAGKHGKV